MDNYASDLWITHGYESHSILDEWKCEECRKVKEEFEQFMQEHPDFLKGKRE